MCAFLLLLVLCLPLGCRRKSDTSFSKFAPLGLTVRVTLEEHYDLARQAEEGVPVPHEVKDYTREIRDVMTLVLSRAGFAIAADDSNDFDGELILRIRGIPVGAPYTDGVIEGVEYAGATIDGEVLARTTHAEHVESFRGEVKPPPRIGGRLPWPSHAPFREAIENAEEDILHCMAAAMSKTFDIDQERILIAALGLEHPDYPIPRVYDLAAAVLAKLKAPGEVDRLLAALVATERVPVMEGLSVALAKVPAQSRPKLLDWLVKGNDRTRRVAAEALGSFHGDPVIVRHLVEALGNESEPWIRHYIALSLGKIGDHDAVPALIEALRSRDWQTRSGAAYALGKLKDNRAVEPLVQALNRALEDKSGNARAETMVALRELRQSSSISAQDKETIDEVLEKVARK